MKRDELLSRLRLSRSRLVQFVVQKGPSLSASEVAEARARILFIEEQVRQLKGRVGFERSLFVSYSEDLSRDRFNFIRDLAATEFEFIVRTGFDYSNIGGILKRARVAIDESTCFLCVMVPRFQVVDPSLREVKSVPSAWVIEEKGMALALGKPFHLLVSNRVHPDFWQKTAPEMKHTLFGDDDFQQAAREALDALSERYSEMVLEQLYFRQSAAT